MLLLIVTVLLFCLSTIRGAYHCSLVHRLCGLASGSVITVTCKLLTLIRFSCLHLGQNKGNFFNIVSFLILSRVLLPQTGHRIHSAVFASIHYLYNSAFIAVSFFVLGTSGKFVNSKGSGRLKVNILSFIALIHKIL